MEVASGPPRERYRCLREKVLALVRAYNEILSQLTPQERRLFSERLVFLDRKIGPGLSKLTWNAKAQLDVYLKETKRHCADASKLVSAFHGNKALLAKSCRQVHVSSRQGCSCSSPCPACKCSPRRLRSCRQIASSPLVSLRKKHVYPQELFISEQSAHQGSVKGKLQDVHKQMKALMRSTHEIFKSDSDEVRSRADLNCL
jgi:dynein heavy chain